MIWNFALNMLAGPNLLDPEEAKINHSESPVLVNSESDEFYKQPTFYALGHYRYYLISSWYYEI